MRISGGAAGRRKLPTATHGVRPTQDRVREALFSSLAELMPEARVLDLFAGSGSLGLEAWSRGAMEVVWVERDRNTFRALKQTIAALGVPPSRGRVVSADVFHFLQRPPAGGAFDLVLADPPYAEALQENHLPQLAALLHQNNWLKPGGLFIFETEGKSDIPAPDGFTLLRDRTYGRTRLLYFHTTP